MTKNRKNALKSSAALASAALILLTAAHGHCAPQPAPEPVPAWYKNCPSAPATANYFYMAESGTGVNAEDAKEKAWQTALQNAERSGAVKVGTPERAVRCSEVLNVRQGEYKVYALFKIQKDDKKSDVHAPDKDVECKNSKFESELKKYNADMPRRDKEFKDEAKKLDSIKQAKDSLERAEKVKLNKIETGLADARRDMARAKELEAAGRKKDALDLVAQCERRLEPLPYYGDLKLDSATRNRIGDEISRLRGEIIDLKAKMKAQMSFFINGRETVSARAANTASELKSRLSKEKYDVVNDRASASYHLNFETSACNVATNPYIDMMTCKVCVTAQVTNLTTGISEGSVDFTYDNKKGVGDDKETACKKAADGLAEELWNRLRRDIGIFSN